jgi:phenylpyruvate tautomerase PptA (4-oxalocrotonate tautomerase family)
MRLLNERVKPNVGYLPGSVAWPFNKECSMPLVRIDVAADTSAETVAAISEVVYEAMLTTANVPEHDKFQIINRHAKDELVYPAAGYLGLNYSPHIVFIQVTWVAGRSVEVKKAFFKAIADGIHSKTGLRKEDIFISLIDVKREDWSFGNGEMQYEPKA